ncbi:MAG TPA: acyltransferase domain-containing protein [Polyangiaceae bacterium]|nr:acyltransferase domain-containing protein [Polyangiaceae bacterium]
MYVDERSPRPRPPGRPAPEASPAAPAASAATPARAAVPADASPAAAVRADDAAAVGGAPGVVFVFSGIGSQWAGMGRSLYASEPAFRAAIEACDEHVRSYAGWSLVAALISPEHERRLFESDVAFPAIVSVEIALAALFRSWGVEPAAVVGHSVGEVAAAHVAGALSLADAMRVICAQGAQIKRLRGQGAMALVARPWAEVGPWPAGRALFRAIDMGPRSCVVAGAPAEVDALVAELSERETFARRVDADVPAHCPLLDVLRDDLLAAVSPISPRAPSLPLVTATAPGEGAPFGPEHWVRNLCDAVLLRGAVAELVGRGFASFVELSPHPLLTRPLEEGGARLALSTLRRGEDERGALLGALATLRPGAAARGGPAADSRAPGSTRQASGPEGEGARARPAPAGLEGARSEVEGRLAEIWARVLRRADVPVDVAFRDLGGDSLSTFSMLAEVRRAFGVALGADDVDAASTLRALAARLGAERAAGGAPAGDSPDPVGADERAALLSSLGLTEAEVEDVFPLTPAQYAVTGWAHARGEVPAEWRRALGPADMRLYCHSRIYWLRGPLDAARLREAFAAMMARHSLLRTAYHWGDLRRPLQYTLRDAGVPWEERPLLPGASSRRRLPGPLRALAGFAAVAAAGREFERAFDPRGPLVRLVLLRAAREEHALVVLFNHATLDAWGAMQLVRDLIAAYDGRAEGPLRATYGDYARWADRASHEGFDRHWREFAEAPRLPARPPRPRWRRLVDALLARLPLYPRKAEGVPTLHLRVSAESRRLARAYAAERPVYAPGDEEPKFVGVLVPEALTRALRAQARRLGVDASVLLIAAWSLALRPLVGAPGVPLRVVDHGRPLDVADSDRMAGHFANYLPALVPIDDGATVGAWLASLKARVADVIAAGRGRVAFVDQAAFARAVDRQAVFNWLPTDEFTTGAQVGDLHVEVPFLQDATLPLLILSRSVVLSHEAIGDRLRVAATLWFGDTTNHAIVRAFVRALRALCDPEGAVRAVREIAPGGLARPARRGAARRGSDRWGSDRRGSDRRGGDRRGAARRAGDRVGAGGRAPGRRERHDAPFAAQAAQELAVRHVAPVHLVVAAEHALAAGRQPREPRLDARAREEHARDAVAREHHAEPARVEVEAARIEPARERVVREHDGPLEPLEAVGRLDQHRARELARQPLGHRVHLRDVGADDADVAGLEAPQATLVAEHGPPFEEPPERRGERPGEPLVDLAARARRQLGHHQARAPGDAVERRVEGRGARGLEAQRALARRAERPEGQGGVERGLDEAHRVGHQAARDGQREPRHLGVARDEGARARHVGPRRVGRPALDLARDDGRDLARVADQHVAPRQVRDLVKEHVGELVRLVDDQHVEALGRPVERRPLGRVGDDDAGPLGQRPRLGRQRQPRQRPQRGRRLEPAAVQEHEAQARARPRQPLGEVEGLPVGLRRDHAALAQVREREQREPLDRAGLAGARGRVEAEGGQAPPVHREQPLERLVGRPAGVERVRRGGRPAGRERGRCALAWPRGAAAVGALARGAEARRRPPLARGRGEGPRRLPFAQR